MAEVENVDLDEMEFDDDMLEDMDVDAGSLFWSLKVPSKGTVEIEQPPMAGYIVRATKACFGPQVTKGSRSVVMCNSSEDPENPTFVPVCVLKEGTHENETLDLVFNESCEFQVQGNKASEVYLTGIYVPGAKYVDDPEDDLLDPMDLKELEEGDIEEAEISDADDVAPQLMDEAEEDASPDATEAAAAEAAEASEEVELSQAQKKRKLNSNEAKTTKAPDADAADVTNKRKNGKNGKNLKKNKKGKNAQNGQNGQNGVKSPQNGAVAAPEASATPEDSKDSKDAAKDSKDSNESNNNKKNNNKKNKKKKGKKHKIAGGMEIKDLKEGSGAAIKKGDTVKVYYIGQLQKDQTIFDKTLSGDGLSFTVGRGEVIKGWDQGLIGMKGAGSKRKLWIPAKMAYGKDGSGDVIPPNSDLLFTVEVKKVN